MAKGDDFGGGLPQGTFDKVAGLASGTTPIPPALAAAAINLMLALAREERQAMYPGPGQTGILDALNAIAVVEQAFKDVQTTISLQTISDLQDAIDAVGKLWQAGPVDASFYSAP